MTKDRNTPEIRFKGFTGDWEQRKLCEVADFNPKADLPETFEYVDLESVVGTQMISHRTETRDAAPSRAQRLAQMGDVFFQTVRPYQRNNYLFAKPDNNYVFSTGYAQMRPMIDAEFLMCFLQTDSFVKVVMDNCTGTSYPAINSNDLSNLEISLPVSEDEQREIGSFITHIDNLITLHHCKVERLKNLKKSMLYKMFPKEGERVPEVRFKGFTGDWEQRKFGDVFEEYSEKNHEDLPPLTIVQGSGTIPREESGRDIKYDKSSLNNYKLVNPGDFILHLRSFEGGLEVANSQGIVSPAYHIFRGIRTDSRFYYPFFRSHDFINILLKPHVYGIRDGKSIDVEGMKSIKIPYPDFDEQKRIGDFFDHLDNAITLHQRKYEKLVDCKKAFLHKMFGGET